MMLRSALLIISLFCFCLPAQSEPSKAAFNILPKKSLNKAKLGINAFVNDQRFGSISSQFREVKNVLGLRHVRVLFHWNDQIQPTPQSRPFFGFYDEIVSSLPSGVNALVIINGVPSWMERPENWIDGNPRRTFLKLWLEQVVERYGNNKRVKAFQVWNEPNMESDPDNQLLELPGKPVNYIELVEGANQIIRARAKKKKIVSAATTAINQNYPDSLDYNKEMRDLGLQEFVDVVGVHFYSVALENFIRPDNVSDYLKSLKKPVWVTESGEKGVNKQREYAQTMWPFLLSRFPVIKRIYIYQFTEATPADSTYGLRNLTSGRMLSDLYIYLRSLKKSRKK